MKNNGLENASYYTGSSYEYETLKSSDLSYEEVTVFSSSLVDEASEMVSTLEVAESSDIVDEPMEHKTPSEYPMITCKSQHSTVSEISIDDFSISLGSMRNRQKEIEALKFRVSDCTFSSKEDINVFLKRMEHDVDDVGMETPRGNITTKTRRWTSSTRPRRNGSRKARQAKDSRIEPIHSPSLIPSKTTKKKPRKQAGSQSTADKRKKRSSKTKKEPRIDPVETSISRAKRRNSRKCLPRRASCNHAGQVIEHREDTAWRSKSNPPVITTRTNRSVSRQSQRIRSTASCARRLVSTDETGVNKTPQRCQSLPQGRQSLLESMTMTKFSRWNMFKSERTVTNTRNRYVC